MVTQPLASSEPTSGEGEPVVVFEDVSIGFDGNPFSRTSRFELQWEKRESFSDLPAWERACC